MKTTARLTFDSLRFDRPATAHLVVTLTAPPLGAGAKRPPVCVIPVIDVSGSMQGEKLHQAKQSVLKLIDHLGPQDRCGVVVFSTAVGVVSPPVEMNQVAKDQLKLRVGDLEAQSNTNLSGGMLAGLELGNLPELLPEMLVRVILFTDGQANHGLATKAEQLLPLLDAHRGRATLSAFGYGHDADQELLSDLAKRGGGNYAFVHGPDDAKSAFARELGGLLSTYAQGLEITVTPARSHHVLSVLSDVDAFDRGGSAVMLMDDILAEEERHLVLTVSFPALDAPASGPAFEVTGRYEVLAGGTKRAESFAATVSAERVVAANAQARPEPALDLILAQVELLRAQLEAEAQARRGDYEGARVTLYQLATVLDIRGQAAVATAARGLGDKMSGEEAYRRSAGHRKSMQSVMKRGASTSSEAEADEVARFIGKKSRTKSQLDMEDSFGGPASPTPRGSPGTGGTPPSQTPPAGSGSLNQRRSKRW